MFAPESFTPTLIARSLCVSLEGGHGRALLLYNALSAFVSRAPYTGVVGNESGSDDEVLTFVTARLM
jgi:hypothetical protein